MTHVGSSSRSTNRVLVALVVITITVVAYWASNGGLEEIQAVPAETAVVAD